MRLGFLVDDLGPSQLAYYLVKNANAHLLHNPQDDVVAFFGRQVATPLAANFAAMPAYEAFGFTGVLVATSLATARTALACVGASARFFYLWDLEWLRPHAAESYRGLAEVYRHPGLRLLARGQGHARAVRRAWNRPAAAVVEDFDFAALAAAVRP